MMKRILALVVALALSPVFGQSITPQIGGGISKGFDGGISGVSSTIPNPNGVKITAEGDSITAGLGGTPTYPFTALTNLSGTPGTGGNTPLSAAIPGVGVVSINDIATSGISAPTILSQYSTRGGTSYDATKSLNVLSLLIGTNNGGTTDYQAIRSYIQLAHVTGYNRCIIGTPPGRDDDGGTAWFATILPLDNNIIAFYNSDLDCDGLMNFIADSRFSPNTAADNTANYNTDKLHPVTGIVGPPATGQQAMGSLAQSQILAVLQAPGVRTLSPMTWSPFDFGGQLANGNRDFVVPTGSAQYCARGFPGVKTGKWNWEVNVLGMASTLDLTSGIANNSFLYNGAHELRNDVNAMGYGSDGNVIYNSTTLAVLPTWAAGDIIQTAYDRGAHLIWFRRWRSGVAQLWNANAAADPATGIGGISTAGVDSGATATAGRVYPGVRIFTGVDALRSNFAASELVNPIPSGFKALDQ